MISIASELHLGRQGVDFGNLLVVQLQLLLHGVVPQHEDVLQDDGHGSRAATELGRGIEAVSAHKASAEAVSLDQTNS